MAEEVRFEPTLGLPLSLSSSQSHVPSSQNQFGVNIFAHGPAGEPTAVKVQNALQIEPALFGGDLSEVPQPDLVEMLRGEETHLPRHWFILDEFAAMGKITCIHDLLARGRSKGISVLLGIQSIEGILQIYGEHTGEDLLGQCAYKTFLRAGSPRTARWIEDYFGRVPFVTVAE